MKEWIMQQDLVEWIFAIAVVVAGVTAVITKDKESAALCLGAAVMYIKGKTK